LHDVDDVLELGFGSDSVFSFVTAKTGEDVSCFLVAADLA
jgi:hypothetical protein